METDNQNWLEGIIQDSQNQWLYLQDEMGRDPDGYKDILGAFLNKEDNCSGCGFLLTGTDHYGREAAAVKAVSLLQDRIEYEVIFLDGLQLCAHGTAVAIERLNDLVNHFYDQKKNICLILQGMEECPSRLEILQYLGCQLRDFRLFSPFLEPFEDTSPEEDKRYAIALFLILLDDREQDIPGLLRRRLWLCRTNIPNLAQRMEYLKKRAEYLNNYLPLEKFAKLTEDASYAQLRDMIEMVDILVESRYGREPGEEELTEFVTGQMPPAPPKNAAERICRTLEHLADRLPETLSSIAIASPAVSPAVSPVAYSTEVQEEFTMDTPEEKDKYLLKKQAEIANMPPKQVQTDLFGKEFVEEVHDKVASREMG